MGLLVFLVACTSPDLGKMARAQMVDAAGNYIGTIDLIQTNSGVLLEGEVQGLSPGGHAIHIHEHGVCDPPEFVSAGEHLNLEGREHGLLNRNGPHAGDMVDIYADARGVARVSVLNPRVQISKDGLARVEGTALMIHAAPDGYTNAPGVSAGARIACGVIK